MLERFTWFRQSAFRYDGDGFVIYIDPWGVTDPRPADAIFITHAHNDHLSTDDIDKVRGDGTKIFAPHDVAEGLSGNVVPVQPGDGVQAGPVSGRAVHAYNVAEERLEMHPKSNKWVGYVLSLGGNDYYHAGDTDHVPELDALKTDVAFVPIGGTYTMDVPEAAGFVKVLQPQLAVPMHYGFFPGVGVASDGEAFRAAADPVKVEVLTPENPFANQ
jgi:L-ascorbate metabolism protein UlaG (beta-lactamase superfamily)